MLAILEDYLERLTDQHLQLERTLKGLSIEALDWTPAPGMNSLCVQVVHVCGSTRFAVGDIAAGISSSRDRDAEFRASGLDEDTLQLRLTDTRTFVRGVLENLSQEDLSQVRPIPGSKNANGEPETDRVSRVLLHTLAHTALHVGHAQITRQLWNQRQT